MKILKWILIIIGVIIAVFLIYSASQPNQLKMEESITINASAEKIYAEVTNFPTWNNWSVWSQLDPNMEQEFSENMGEVGSYSQWKSQNPMVGNGRQDVEEIRKNEYMKVGMQFDGMEGTAFAEFILEPTDSGTLVRWTFIGAETPFYLNFINRLMEPMLTDSYKKSLTALKEYIEAMPTNLALPANTVIEEISAQPIISILDSTTADGISAKLTEMYTELSIFIESNKEVNMAGMPLAIYHVYSPEKVVMEGAFPISGTAKKSGRINVGNLYEGTVIKGIHYGDYSATEDLHFAISDYAEAAGYTLTGSPWEIYANDPTLVDSSEVETQIFYPVTK